MDRTQKRIERLLASIRRERPSLTSRGLAFNEADAAEKLGITTADLDALVRARAIRTVKVGGVVLVLRSEIRRAAGKVR